MEGIAGVESILHAAAKVRFENFRLHRGQTGTGGLELLQDIEAVAPLVNHGVNAGKLPFHAIETFEMHAMIGVGMLCRTAAVASGFLSSADFGCVFLIQCCHAGLPYGLLRRIL